MPPVSTIRSFRPAHSASPYNRSRVMPGSSPTIARRDPIMRLNKVDLPTFGRPTMAMVGIAALTAVELLEGWGKRCSRRDSPSGYPRVEDPSCSYEVFGIVIIETPWRSLLIPLRPPHPRAGNPSTNSSPPAASSRRCTPPTNSAVDNSKWPRPLSRRSRRSAT